MKEKKLSILDFPQNETTMEFLRVLWGETVYRQPNTDTLPPNDALVSNPHYLDLLAIRDSPTTFTNHWTKKVPTKGLHYDLVDVLDYSIQGEGNVIAKTKLSSRTLLESRLEQGSYGQDCEERKVWEHKRLVYHERVENDAEGDLFWSVRVYEPGSWEQEIEQAAKQANTM